MPNDPEINIKVGGLDDLPDKINKVTDSYERFGKVTQQFSDEDVPSQFTEDDIPPSDISPPPSGSPSGGHNPPNNPFNNPYMQSQERQKVLSERVARSIDPIGANIAAGYFQTAQAGIDKSQYNLEQLKALSENEAATKELTDSLDKLQQTLDESRAEAKASAGGGGVINDLAGVGLGGMGPFGRMLGRLGNLISNPAVAAPLAIAGAVRGGDFLTKWALSLGEEARTESKGFLDLSRQLGIDDPLIQNFTQGGNFFQTREELEKSLFTTGQAGQFASQFGMARQGGLAGGETLFQDVAQGLQLARVTGTEPNQIASLMRQGVIAGTADQDMSSFISILYQAVKDGTEEGVSSAETFSNISTYLEQLTQKGLTSTALDLASTAQALGLLGDTGTRLFQGEAGMGFLQKVQGRLTASSGDAFELMALQALGVGTGRGMPTSSDLNLDALDPTGKLSAMYDSLTNEVQQGRLIMALGASGKPEVLKAVSKPLHEAFKDNAMLDLELGKQFMNLSPLEAGFSRAHFGSTVGIFQHPDFGKPEFLEQLKGTPLEDIQQRNREAQGTDLGYLAQAIDFRQAEIERVDSLAAATNDWLKMLIDLRQKFSDFRADFWETLNETVLNPAGWAARIQQHRLENQFAPRVKVDPFSNFNFTDDEGEMGYTMFDDSEYKVIDPSLIPKGKPTTDPFLDFRFDEGDSGGSVLPPEVSLEGIFGSTHITSTPGAGHRGYDYVVGRRYASDPVPNPFPGATVSDVQLTHPSYGPNITLSRGEDQIRLAHFNSIAVEKGQKLIEGQNLGMEGNIGKGDGGIHLHAEPLNIDPTDKDAVDALLKRMMQQLPSDESSAEPISSTGSQNLVMALNNLTNAVQNAQASQMVQVSNPYNFRRG